MRATTQEPRLHLLHGELLLQLGWPAGEVAGGLRLLGIPSARGPLILVDGSSQAMHAGAQLDGGERPSLLYNATKTPVPVT